MVDIKGNIADVTTALPHNVEQLAVIRFHPIKALREANGCDLRWFGVKTVCRSCCPSSRIYPPM